MTVICIVGSHIKPFMPNSRNTREAFTQKKRKNKTSFYIFEMGDIYML